MTRIVLDNKPLVEAIFELKWNLEENASKMKIDPHYEILIGSIYERIKDEYHFHERLPTATIPDEMAGYIIQHRFRTKEKKWPLIQIGPGIITLNDTEGYTWEDFEKRVLRMISVLYEAYPDLEKLKCNGLSLRYIDAVDFDFENDYIFAFLEEKMKINLKLHQKLFDDTGVNKYPFDFDLRFSFPSKKPKGAVRLRFSRGKRKENDALIWETMVQSVKEDVPKTKDELNTWIKAAHNLTNDWFFKIIEGELLERFK